ncbi:hypothetical protein HYC85_002465 [Camellia sinensis]|uniref:Uncharacterized protein n=1 Tax=Camellia sinensis TaxID=4442 RepID=A0A7J7I9S1_CAMSI|nr:hypothetical protein HYC85_002465 [Camellia sinensis]
MLTLRSRDQTLETPANPSNHQINEDGRTQIKETQKVSGYEQCREERIKENLQRMQKLGIMDLSLKLKSLKPIRKNNFSNRKSPPCPSPLTTPGGPLRRSSRLQNVTPVAYSEVILSKKDTFLEGEHDLIRGGLKPEVYTDEHEKLLGNTEMSWTLFVDGYGQDGKRIYDPIKGKTCHQCRSGFSPQLHKRYFLVNEWPCCFAGRKPLVIVHIAANVTWSKDSFAEIVYMGSMCLKQNRTQTGFALSVGEFATAVCAGKQKDGLQLALFIGRSLPFSDMEATSEGKECPMSNNDHHGLVTPKHEGNKTDNESKGEKCEETNFSENKHGSSDIALASSQKTNKRAQNSASSDYHEALSEAKSEDNKTDDKQCDNNVVEESSPKSKGKPPRTLEPAPDSVAGRLRQRRRTSHEHDKEFTQNNI